MTVIQGLIDPFHRELTTRLTAEIDKRIEQLTEGSAKRYINDSETVAEKYASQITYIKALRDVLTICVELEQARYGAKPKTPTDNS